MPAVPLAVVALLITGADRMIVSARLCVAVPAPLVAERVTFVCPAAVGLPEMTPVVLLIDKPAGRPVAPKLVGPFFAATV